MDYPLALPFFTSFQGLLLAGVAKQEWEKGNGDKKNIHQIAFAIESLAFISRQNEVEHGAPNNAGRNKNNPRREFDCINIEHSNDTKQKDDA